MSQEALLQIGRLIGYAVGSYRKPISEQRVCQICRILDYSEKLIPVNNMPADLIDMVYPYLKNDVDKRTKISIEAAIHAGFVKRDERNPSMLVPLLV